MRGYENEDALWHPMTLTEIFSTNQGYAIGSDCLKGLMRPSLGKLLRDGRLLSLDISMGIWGDGDNGMLWEQKDKRRGTKVDEWLSCVAFKFGKNI